jgi:hypothetical protein
VILEVFAPGFAGRIVSLIMKIIVPIDYENIIDGLPAYPQYTQPVIFEKKEILEVFCPDLLGE